MLQRQRVDAVVAPEPPVDSLLSREKERFAGIVKTPLRLPSTDYYLVLSKDFIKEAPDLAGRIWQAIAKARTTHFSQLAKRY